MKQRHQKNDVGKQKEKEAQTGKNQEIKIEKKEELKMKKKNLKNVLQWVIFAFLILITFLFLAPYLKKDTTELFSYDEKINMKSQKMKPKAAASKVEGMTFSKKEKNEEMKQPIDEISNAGENFLSKMI